jgi:uncharacterized caspase-like protein
MALIQTSGRLCAGVFVWPICGRPPGKRVSAATTFFLAAILLANVLCTAALTAFVVLATTHSVNAAEDARVALVIGNGAYMNAPRLDNPVLDAKAVADAFRKLGFRVVDGYDLDIAQMRTKISEFSADLPGAKSAVVYYAGHGISVDEENYLIPTDIVLKSPTDLDLGAISVSLLLKQMKREDRVNIVILDACRDNPFASELAKHTRALVGERGLSRIDGDLARGTLIAFASDPKSTALDGSAGEHSPFTKAFLDHVSDSGVSIDTVMSRVRTEVWEKTRHIQLPWVNTSLIGDYALSPQPSAEGGADAAKAPAETPGRATAADSLQTQEDLLWESAQHSNLSADYQAYLDAFPNGVFARMAKNRIANLAAAATPPRLQVEQSPAPAQVPQKLATNEAAEPSGKDWKAEIGTAETEKALNLTPADEKEIQRRLISIDIYKGPETGALDTATRAALADWQKSRGVAPTSFLGPRQLAELRIESDSAYEKYLARSAPPQRAGTPSVKPTRAAKTMAKEPPPARHLAKRSSPASAASAVGGSGATLDPGGTPAWRARAGLPDNSGAPQRGRPPEF